MLMALTMHKVIFSGFLIIPFCGQKLYCPQNKCYETEINVKGTLASLQTTYVLAP